MCAEAKEQPWVVFLRLCLSLAWNSPGRLHWLVSVLEQWGEGVQGAEEIILLISSNPGVGL